MNKPVAELNRALSSRPQGNSQATSIEQSRAIAEVQSMVVVAQNCPRDEARAIQSMREACGRMHLAEMAFFKFPRGGQTVTGPTVHLARELARCWGNINYGVSELDRDDIGGKSEMVAYAWDVQTNARAATAFIVPHKRDKKGGAELLVDMRDIYENNANNAARRVREMVFSILPKWYVEEAKAICRNTLEKGDGEKPVSQRAADALAVLEKLGISRERVEAKVGSKSSAWTPVDLANLAVAYRSLKSKEVTAEDEFPSLGAASLSEALKGAVPESSEGPTVDTARGRRVAELGSSPGPRSTEDEDAETEAVIDAGAAAESGRIAAEESHAHCNTLMAELADLHTPTSINAYAKMIAADLALLPAAERGRFNSAKLARERDVGAVKK